MKRNFTKKDLHTGDIIENRAGERGVVILENDCIVYQAGGLDIFKEVFTDDLFVDGTDRPGDIMKVYHDDEDGCLGFNKLFGLEPVFVRRNDKGTRERAAGLSEKHDPNKGMVTAILLEPCYRKYGEIFVDPSVKKDISGIGIEAIEDIDMEMSEAPSMTAAGEIKIDRTFVPFPDAENLFLLYNQYQEEWHLQIADEHRRSGHPRDDSPVFVIPEENIAVHSRCLIVRKDESGRIVNLEKDDLEKAKKYMVRMEERRNK